jgi:hypothetical protein
MQLFTRYGPFRLLFVEADARAIHSRAVLECTRVPKMDQSLFYKLQKIIYKNLSWRAKLIINLIFLKAAPFSFGPDPRLHYKLHLKVLLVRNSIV